MSIIPPQLIRIMIVDDHVMVRRGLSTFLNVFDDLQLVGEAESGAAAALRAFHQSLREVETSRENVLAAEENLRIVGDQYREGLLRTTDVLDAESVLAESRSALAERRYRAYSQQVALLAVLGEDLPAFYESTTSLEK